MTGAFVSRLESYLMGRILKETVLASYNGSVHATKNVFVFVCCVRVSSRLLRLQSESESSSAVASHSRKGLTCLRTS